MAAIRLKQSFRSTHVFLFATAMLSLSTELITPSE